MTEEEAKKWVKDKVNVSSVLEKFFKDHTPVKSSVSFFMAGIPGAGKTEFANNTIRESSPNLIPIEHDMLVEYIPGYKPEDYYNYRKAGSALVTELLKVCLTEGYAFIFDGTLSHENGIRNVRKTIKAGYSVYIVYIVQDVEASWKLTQARELDIKRSIEKSGFINTCNIINSSLLNIFIEFKNNKLFNFWLIHKHGLPGMENATAIFHGPSLDKARLIERELNKSYNVKVIE